MGSKLYTQCIQTYSTQKHGCFQFEIHVTDRIAGHTIIEDHTFEQM
jgi:hypothetical protein